MKNTKGVQVSPGFSLLRRRWCFSPTVISIDGVMLIGRIRAIDGRFRFPIWFQYPKHNDLVHRPFGTIVDAETKGPSAAVGVFQQQPAGN